MFGGNLYADVSLVPLYRELLGLEGFKPFECVGTPEETIAAFLLAHERGEYEKDVIMNMCMSEVIPTIAKPDEVIGKALLPNNEHNVPKEFQKILPL